MSILVKAARKGANALLRRVQPDNQIYTDWDAIWFIRAHVFEFDGKKHDLFVHQHNCGWPPGRMTERSVELALADHWLDDPAHADVLEIGAVTPYYWPKRVKTVVDPGDDHPLVTAKTSMMDLNLTGRRVLAISTLEHVGNGEYGLPPLPLEVISAFEKLFREAEAFLVTVPMGYNPTLDAYLERGEGIPSDVSLKYLVRSPKGGNDWREAERPSKEQARYGPLDVDGNRGSWANAVAVFRRRSKTSRPEAP